MALQVVEGGRIKDLYTWKGRWRMSHPQKLISVFRSADVDRENIFKGLNSNISGDFAGVKCVNIQL